MRSTLKDSLLRCLNALKKMLAQREKWLTEWPGQVHPAVDGVMWLPRRFPVGAPKHVWKVHFSLLRW